MDELDVRELRNLNPAEGRARATEIRRERECVLDEDGECECGWCVEIGWPGEIDVLTEAGGLEGRREARLRRMPPTAGRREVEKERMRARRSARKRKKGEVQEERNAPGARAERLRVRREAAMPGGPDEAPAPGTPPGVPSVTGGGDDIVDLLDTLLSQEEIDLDLVPGLPERGGSEEVGVGEPRATGGASEGARDRGAEAREALRGLEEEQRFWEDESMEARSGIEASEAEAMKWGEWEGVSPTPDTDNTVGQPQPNRRRGPDEVRNPGNDRRDRHTRPRPHGPELLRETAEGPTTVPEGTGGTRLGGHDRYESKRRRTLAGMEITKGNGTKRPRVRRENSQDPTVATPLGLASGSEAIGTNNTAGTGTEACTQGKRQKRAPAGSIASRTRGQKRTGGGEERGGQDGGQTRIQDEGRDRGREGGRQGEQDRGQDKGTRPGANMDATKRRGIG